MKHAITGPKGRIFQVLDEPNDRTVEITEEQATIVANSTDKLGHFVVNGVFMTGQEAMAILQAEREAARFATLSPEQQAIETAYNTAASVFESLDLGKQALWEPVRVAVAKAIKAGDMTKAYQIIATLPVVYEGAEADRQMFLSLF